MPARYTLAAAAALLISAAAPTVTAATIAILVPPTCPFIEVSGNLQLINFDIRASNPSAQPFHLVGITLTVFDHAGALEQQRALDMNCFPGALSIVGSLDLPAHGAQEIFQPFTNFPVAIEPYRLHFDLTYMRNGRRGLPVPFIADLTVPIDVFPQRFQPASYCLPLRGSVLVQDGHDFFSHHRRFARPLPLSANTDTAPAANLYADDIVRIGKTGNLFTSTPTDKHHWLTYGAPVFADAAGTVVASATKIAEHSFLPDGSASSVNEAADPNGFGNYVELLHSDGRASWILHMQPHSVRAKPGHHIDAGVTLGLVGFSGDALFPHLDYTVTQGTFYPSRGVPAYFRDFARIYGTNRVNVARGPIDSGDVVESAPNCADDPPAH